jgi:hypothetical protein
MTDQAIRDMAMGDWVGVLTGLWDAIGKPADKKQLAVYIRELGGVPLGILERVVSSLLAKHTYHTVPTIGDFWQETWLTMGHTNKDRLELGQLKWELANWSPTPRVDRYAEVTQ